MEGCGEAVRNLHRVRDRNIIMGMGEGLEKGISTFEVFAQRRKGKCVVLVGVQFFYVNE